MATESAILTLTLPGPKGLIFAVNIVPLPVKSANVPLSTVISSATNPYTGSLNVKVTGIGETLVASGEVLDIRTVGASAPTSTCEVLATLFRVSVASTSLIFFIEPSFSTMDDPSEIPLESALPFAIVYRKVNDLVPEPLK